MILNSKTILPDRKILSLIFISMLMFFQLAFLSSNISFSKKYFIEKNLLTLLSEDDVKKSYSIKISGRVSNHPYNKNGNCLFEIGDATFVFISKNSNDRYYMKNIGNIDISLNLAGDEELFPERDDFVIITTEGFNTYQDYTNSKKVIFYSNKIEPEKETPFSYFLFKTRKKIFTFLSSKYREYFSYRDYSFSTAILLGNTNELSNQVKNSFMRSGLYHMLSISGLHISILFSIINTILVKFNRSFFKRSNIFIDISSYFLLLIFNMVVGLKAAMLRASIFFAIRTYSGYLKRFNLSINIFFATLIVMLLFFPEFLYDTGFILSFTATAGILIINPFIKKIVGSLSIGRQIKNNYFFRILLVNISVNIFILPLSFHYFGGYCILSFISNMICTPVFDIILFMLFLSSIFTFVIPVFGGVLLKSIIPMLNVFMNLSVLFSSCSFGYIESGFFNKPLNIFIYYSIIAFIMILTNYFLFVKSRMKSKIIV